MPSASPPAAPTIVHLLERNARIHADRPACYDKLSGSWVATSWRDLDAATRTFGRALVAGGVDAGDVVTILGANRPEWTIAALGAMRVGAIAAGIYTSSSPDEIAYILHHGESKLVVVEDADLLERVRAVWDRVPSLATVVLMRGAEGPGGDERILTWDEFAARAEGVDNAELDRRRDALRADQVADFIYTSGTTGPPKAVMLTHENLR
ncbi:MAG: AMP-binding protein, partial [Acidimicrobiia bacterium]|nr:AMP-binding protein [Acidimicrobiia bacterium]